MSALAKREEAQIIPASGNAMTPMEMLDRALSNGATAETLEKLMALQERWEANQARKAFDEAVAEAKAEIPPIVRTATGHNAKKYADFATIAKAVDHILSKHGLSYRFRSKQDERINVTCILSHRAGHSEETTLSGPPDTTGNKNAVQAIGSTLTYLQRYSLIQALGLAASDDDDGRSAATELLSEEQVNALNAALDVTGSSREKFLKWAKVTRIEDIPATYYDSCLSTIQNAARK